MKTTLDIGGMHCASCAAIIERGLKKADGVELRANSSLSGGLSIVSGHTSASTRFYTGGTADANERMTILSGGNVGVGTVSPDFKLHTVANSVSNRHEARFSIEQQNRRCLYHRYT